MSTHTRTRGRIALALVACAALLSLGAPARLDASAESLNVTVKYTGKGQVDKDHRLWIWLFDSPDIGPGSMPIAEGSVDTNGGVATFEGLANGQVWIAAAFDERGGFAGNSPPPPGAPIGIYGMEAGAPAPVKPGAEPVLSFDDSMRMP